MKTLFEDYGIELLQENERFYIRFDAGGLVSSYETIEITSSEAYYVKASPKNAYDVIIDYQNKTLGLNE